MNIQNEYDKERQDDHKSEVFRANVYRTQGGCILSVHIVDGVYLQNKELKKSNLNYNYTSY